MMPDNKRYTLWCKQDVVIYLNILHGIFYPISPWVLRGHDCFEYLGFGVCFVCSDYVVVDDLLLNYLSQLYQNNDPHFCYIHLKIINLTCVHGLKFTCMHPKICLFVLFYFLEYYVSYGSEKGGFLARHTPSTFSHESSPPIEVSLTGKRQSQR